MKLQRRLKEYGDISYKNSRAKRFFLQLRNASLIIVGITLLVIACSVMVSFGADDEYKVHHNISINLNGGDCASVYYMSEIDNGDRQGEVHNDLRVGDYLSDYFGAYHYIADYGAPNPVANGTISAYYDCVGVTPYVRIENVYRSGYTFAGWSVSGDWDKHSDYGASGIKVNIGAFTDEDIVITANWIRNSYTLDVNTYYLNESGGWTYEGANFSHCVVDVDVNGSRAVTGGRDYCSSLTGDSSFNIKVRCIAGWQVNSALSGAMSGSLTSDRNINIYVMPMTYKVSYNSGYAADYGISVSGMPQPETFYYGYTKRLSGTVNKPSATYGLIFKGWGRTPSQVNNYYNDYTTIKEYSDINLYAVWDYKIRFNPNVPNIEDLSGNMNDSILQLGRGGTIPKCVYNRVGYEFVGWNTKADGGGSFIKDVATDVRLFPDASGYVNLYAIWKPIEYTVRLAEKKPEEASGTIASIGDSESSWDLDEDGYYYKKVYYDETFALPKIKELYSLDGWSGECWEDNNGNRFEFDGEARRYNFTKNKGEVVTLYTVWKQNKYSIELDSNGGFKVDEDVITNYEDKTELPDAPKRPGYSFIGWNSNKDGSGTSYKDKDIVDKLVKDNEGKITLYATWELKDVVCIRTAANCYNSTLVNDNAAVYAPEWFNLIGSKSYKYNQSDNVSNFVQVWDIQKNCLTRLK